MLQVQGGYGEPLYAWCNRLGTRQSPNHEARDGGDDQGRHRCRNRSLPDLKVVDIDRRQWLTDRRLERPLHRKSHIADIAHALTRVLHEAPAHKLDPYEDTRRGKNETGKHEPWQRSVCGDVRKR